MNKEDIGVTSPSAPVDGAGCAAKPSAGQWIFITGWRGPLLRVISANKVAICEDNGRRARIELREIIAIGDTREDAKRAHEAFLRIKEDRRGELMAALDASREADRRCTEVRRSIKESAIAAARAAVANAEARS